MADAKITFKFKGNKRPSLSFMDSNSLNSLIAVRTGGSEDFSVTVNWGEGDDETFTDPTAVVKSGAYSNAAAFYTVTVEGGFLDSAGSNRYFALPSQTIIRTDNDFLNPKRDVLVSEHSDGRLIFKMGTHDYAGLDSSTTIKVTTGTYTFKNLTGGTLTIGGSTIGASTDVSFTSSSSLAYSATGLVGDAVSGSFEFASDYSENNPSNAGQFWKMKTSKHRVNSPAYTTSSTLQYNNSCRQLLIDNNNFIISGTGDFAFFRECEVIKYKTGSETYNLPSGADALNFTFAGCVKLRSGGNLPNKLAGTVSSISGVLSGFAADLEKDNASAWRRPGKFGDGLTFTSCSDMSYAFEFSNYDKWLGVFTMPNSTLTDAKSMFEGTSYDYALKIGSKLSSTADITNLFKNCIGFNNSVSKGGNSLRYLNVTNMTGGYTMFDGSNLDSSHQHWSVAKSRVVTNRASWNQDSYIKLYYNNIQITETFQWWIRPVSGQTVNVAVSGHTGAFDFAASYPTAMSNTTSSLVLDMPELDSSYTDPSAGINGNALFNPGDDIVFTITGDVERFMMYHSGRMEHDEGSGLDKIEIKGMSTMTSAKGMCNLAESLTEVDISNWDSRNVKSFESAFSYCGVLESIDTSELKTESATDFSNMFSYCFALKKITGIGDWKTDRMTNADYMFYNCGNLNKGTTASPTMDISGWCTARVMETGDVSHWTNLESEGHGFTRQPDQFQVHHGADGLGGEQSVGLTEPTWGQNCSDCSPYIQGIGYADCA